MTTYDRLMISRRDDAFGDFLVAQGLARVVADLLERQVGDEGEVDIVDQGAVIELRCDPPLMSKTVEEHGKDLLLTSPIKTVKNAASLPQDVTPIDYEVEKERNSRFYEALRNKMEAERPMQHWDTVRAINPSALSGYNSLVSNWIIARTDPRSLLLLLDTFSTAPNDLDTAAATWKALAKENRWRIKPDATAQQLYNPVQGKGQNATKADGLRINNLNGFWLVEWLKIVGFYEAAVTRLVRGTKDRKSYVLAPLALNVRRSQAVMDAFRTAMRSSDTSIRMDIFAVLRYTRALMEHATESDDEFGFSQPNERVAGFHTAFYKNLGNATATMNTAFLGLPGWIKVNADDDYWLFLDPENGLLAEFEKVVGSFEESHSDAATLLAHLRDFVSGDDLEAFFRFTNAFSAYYISKQERGQYSVSFTTHFIERLVMSVKPALTEIVRDDGFRNIAYAIRQSTRTAQIRRKNGDRKYETRYGLGQDLARNARYPNEFVAALMDFLHKYNAENVRVMETRSGPYRKSISTEDIDRIVTLIDRFGSQTVANLLIAYGYARVPRDPDMQDQPESEMETES